MFVSPATPLHEVTFVVLDLETTGLSPDQDRITEVGAVKSRGGDVLGELATLVQPQRRVPAAITAVTGITDRLLHDQPPIEAVLPTLLEFLHGSVLVAHNAGFDTRFLNAALARAGYEPLRLPVVDTAAVARRVLRDEVRSCALASLAQHLRARTAPEHRALPDARATLDVLHALLERIGTLGATTLEDLQDYTRSTTDRAYRKIALVRDAPPAPGVYRFLGERGEVLYVGKARDLRIRLRRYFGQDRRRRIADLVRETATVTWQVTATELEASVREVAEIQRCQPRYNRRSRFPDRQVALRLTQEPFPRLTVSTRAHNGLWPVSSRRIATEVVEAIHDISPIRRCTPRLRLAQDHPTCVLKDLGRCVAPCDATIDRAAYAAVADEVAQWLAEDPTGLLDGLRARMRWLAATRRFEDAAVTRRRLHTLARVVERVRRLRALAGVDELVAGRWTPAGTEVARIVRGRLAGTLVVGGPAADGTDGADLVARVRALGEPARDGTLGPEDVEGCELVLRWLDQRGVRLLAVEGCWALPVAGGAALTTAVGEARSVERQRRHDHRVLTDAKTVELVRR